MIRHRASHLITMIVLGLLFLAGVLKLLDLSSFYRDLGHWSIIPSAFRGPLTILVPLIEVGTAGCWLLVLELRWSRIAGLSLLLCFVTALALEMAFSGEPHCGCFGLMDRWLEQPAGTRVSLARSGVMAVSLLLAILISSPRRRSESTA